MRKKLISSFNWLFVDRVYRLTGGALLGIWIARYLGPSDFGALNYAIAFVTIFAVVAKLGFNQIVVREMVNEPDSEGPLLCTTFFLRLATGLLLLPAVLIAAWTTKSESNELFLLISLFSSSLIFQALETFEIYFQKQIASKSTALARGLAFTIFAIAKIIFIYIELPAAYFAAALSLELGLAGLLMSLDYYRSSGFTKWRFDSNIAKSLLSEGWPLIVTSALIFIHQRVDQVMLGNLLGSDSVGIYSVSVSISDLWLFIPLILVHTLTPALLELREVNHDLYISRLMQIYCFMFWTGIAVGLITTIFGKAVVSYVFGAQYSAAYQPLAYMIWAGIFVSQSVVRSIWMVGEKLQKYVLVINLFAVAINLAANFLLIPAYGINGAALATLLSVSVCSWLIPLLFRPIRESNLQMIRAVNPHYLVIK